MTALGEWYVINTHIGKEKRVKKLIEGMNNDGIDVCNLCSLIIERKNNVLRYKSKSIFSGYIFIRGTLHVSDYIYIKELSDVIGFICEDFIPISVADKHINVLLDKAMEYPGNVIPESVVSVNGGKIEIVEGPLMGFEPIVKKTALRNRRIYLALSLFNNPRIVSMPAKMAVNL